MELFVANWKMNLGGRDSLQVVSELLDGLDDRLGAEVVICPPFTALFMVGERLAGSWVNLGCQTIHYEDKGAFTGEISPAFAREAGCRYVIIGHSERRSYFGEKGETIKKKIRTAAKWQLQPILCVGETLQQREANQTWRVVSRQLEEASAEDVDGLIVAYEPVWAIGTGRTALPEEAAATAARMREQLKGIDNLRVLYGGSVTPDNIARFMERPEFDGALIGGASLKAGSFLDIINWKKHAK